MLIQHILLWAVLLPAQHGVQAFLVPPTPTLTPRHSSITTARNYPVSGSSTVTAGTTQLHVSPQEELEEPKPSSFSTRLIRNQILNQLLLGYTIWNGGLGAQTLSQSAHFDAGALALGVAGLLPLWFLSRQIETSEAPAVADLNVSTNLLVVRMFGDKPQPISALLVSGFTASLTGLVEETVFRGEVIPQLAAWSTAHDTILAGLPAGAILSTLIFAALHVNPLSLFTGGKEGLADGLVLLVYQLITGSAFCLLYLLSGNLAVPIITHALYDLYTFYNTHLVVTTQMQYANENKLLPVASSSVEDKWRSERGDSFLRDVKEIFLLADSNRDGVLSRQELRIALYSYGIRLSQEQSATVTQAADLDDSGAIDIEEFLEFVGPTGSPGKAIKQSLLGVNG
eukprot:CAMPEP_0202001630 /NCGR_PEP_ID=MMETSP0905-20130828/7689_1 /ASSEMBLY_ACC=CAM_ASM_000554 /TAXON_ID=420261 /ORGANISM="Thalassiosira antarctica, Strain CCMP982" /LENGTH=397 /DNA_ID=CAMNT_0048558363 /DNA_START=93 /DNA_END=1286 /DNA_ORIENTATION=+